MQTGHPAPPALDYGQPPAREYRPSDVLVTGNAIFVADGHGGDSNARIVKFDRNGKYIKEWGRKGSGPGEFDTPHGLVLDPQGRLLVADRGNSRVQVFDQDGKFIAEWKQFGRPSGIILERAGMLYAADSESGTPQINPDIKQGVRIGSERDGKVRFFVPDPVEPKGNREGIAVDRDGIIYVARTAEGFRAPPPRDAGDHGMDTGRPAKVLLVDDEEDVRGRHTALCAGHDRHLRPQRIGQVELACGTLRRPLRLTARPGRGAQGGLGIRRASQAVGS